MSVHTRTTRRHIPENGILHSHRRENLKSYNITGGKCTGKDWEICNNDLIEILWRHLLRNFDENI
jgi:hypothetical protein